MFELAELENICKILIDICEGFEREEKTIRWQARRLKFEEILKRIQEEQNVRITILKRRNR